MTDLDALVMACSTHARQIRELTTLGAHCSENILLASEVLKSQQVRLEILEEKVNLLQRQLKKPQVGDELK